MIGTMGWQQLLLILVILALLFGARRVSDLGGALGRGVREFRSEVRDGNNEEEKKGETDTDQPAEPTAEPKAESKTEQVAATKDESETPPRT